MQGRGSKFQNFLWTSFVRVRLSRRCKILYLFDLRDDRSVRSSLFFIPRRFEFGLRMSVFSVPDSRTFVGCKYWSPTFKSTAYYTMISVITILSWISPPSTFVNIQEMRWCGYSTGWNVYFSTIYHEIVTLWDFPISYSHRVFNTGYSHCQLKCPGCFCAQVLEGSIRSYVSAL